MHEINIFRQNIFQPNQSELHKSEDANGDETVTYFLFKPNQRQQPSETEDSENRPATYEDALSQLNKIIGSKELSDWLIQPIFHDPASKNKKGEKNKPPTAPLTSADLKLVEQIVKTM